VWRECAFMANMRTSGDLYTMFAAHTGTGKSNSHTLNSIEVYSADPII